MIFSYFQKKWVLGYSWSTLLWHRCYYPHRSRDALSPVCGIFFVYPISQRPSNLHLLRLSYFLHLFGYSVSHVRGIFHLALIIGNFSEKVFHIPFFTGHILLAFFFFFLIYQQFSINIFCICCFFIGSFLLALPNPHPSTVTQTLL